MSGARRPHQIDVNGVRTKKCGSCLKWLVLTSFCRRAASWDGLAAKCRDCGRVSKRAWFESNRETANAYTRNWVARNLAARAAIRKRWDSANREYYAVWRDENADRKKANDAAWYAANRERAQAANRAWKVANPTTSRQLAVRSAARRRARKRMLPSEPWTEDQVIDRDGFDCWMCNTPVGLLASTNRDARGWQIDHLIPLSVDYPGHPGDTLANLAVACEPCNNRKRALLLPDAIARFEQNVRLLAS